MAKPMLVTLPCVLLLLHFWPLRRVPGGPAGSRLQHLIVEKLPLVVLSILSAAATLMAQKQAIARLDWLPVTDRIANALVAYVVYVKQMFVPDALAPFYPRPAGGRPFLATVLAVCFLAGGTFLFAKLRRKTPALLVGWVWFLVTLLPVIGLVQVGEQAHADRYTYLPHIGLALMLVMALHEAPMPGWLSRRHVAAAGGLTLAALAFLTCRQTAHWRDSEALWRQALAVTRGNYIAHNNLGMVLADRGADAEAAAHFQRALDSKPNFAEAHNNLGTMLAGQGHLAEAIPHFEQAILQRKSYAEAHLNLGNALARGGHTALAIDHFNEALRLRPNSAKAHHSLAAVLVLERKTDEAVSHFQRAIELNPALADAHLNLGLVLFGRQQYDIAVEHFLRAAQLQPRNVEIRYRLGLARCARRGLSHRTRCL